MSLSSDSRPIAVIDVETTGLFPFRQDRVVELAAVIVRPDGAIEREFSSLINPARDIGPTRIHGLTSQDVLHAPRFEEIAGLLMEALEGTVAVAAHNVRFDRQFLESELSRLGHALPDCLSICTMQLAGGGKLSECCQDYGIPGESANHQALADARCAARLLICLLADQPRAIRELGNLPPVQWPQIAKTGKQPVTRDDSIRRQAEPPTYLQRLLGRVHNQALPIATDGAVMAYAALLDRVLEDRNVDDSEADLLVETASEWGLTSDQIDLTHRDYLNQLAVAAVADAVVTDSERRDLQLVSRLLGQDKRDLAKILSEAAAKVSEARRTAGTAPVTESRLVGMTLCFTGELRCRLNGQPISRECAEGLATKAGLVVMDNVTKKLQLLVTADPQSQSGKALKARKYGIRIMNEPVFWKAIGVSVE